MLRKDFEAAGNVFDTRTNLDGEFDAAQDIGQRLNAELLRLRYRDSDLAARPSVPPYLDSVTASRRD